MLRIWVEPKIEQTSPSSSVLVLIQDLHHRGADDCNSAHDRALPSARCFESCCRNAKLPLLGLRAAQHPPRPLAKKRKRAAAWCRVHAACGSIGRGRTEMVALGAAASCS